MRAIAFLGGFILGALSGAVATALMAPQPGNELQAEIRQRWATMLQEGRRAADERRAELEAKFAAAKQFTPVSAGS